MSATAAQPRCGGFSTCSRPCVECSRETHHFAEIDITFAASEPEHEAAKLGVVAWWQCRHCDTWIESMEEDDLDEGPDVSILSSLPSAPRRTARRRDTLLGHAKVDPSAICQCGHRADSHAPELPSPCGHGRTMPDAEIIARCMDPDLAKDPRYGCRCIGFAPGVPS